jgi:hypothetical protein
MIRAHRTPAAALTVFALLALVPVATPGASSAAPATETPAPAAGSAASPTAAATLPAWLVGTWRMERGERVITETWLDGGNALFGVSVTTKAGRTVEFEFLRIERREGRLAYVAQPGGRPPTVFALATSDDRSLRFENLAHDFPQVIRYALEGEAGLVAEISGPMNGKTESMRFEYRRVAGE